MKPFEFIKDDKFKKIQCLWKINLSSNLHSTWLIQFPHSPHQNKTRKKRSKFK